MRWKMNFQVHTGEGKLPLGNMLVKEESKRWFIIGPGLGEACWGNMKISVQEPGNQQSTTPLKKRITKVWGGR